jgi:predicted nucleic acid-binding protein
MILTDTGFWLAFFNAKDKHHLQSVKIMSQLDEKLITTWPVITETCYLLGEHLNSKSQLRFVKVLEEDYVEIFDLQIKHLPRIHQLMYKYADLPMDFADASLVILAEELGYGRILSTDKRDFHTYRWKNRHPFQNLLM